MVSVNHSIKMVAQLTGLTPHVIRVWEKRYQAVTPSRSPSNRRLYTEAEIQRLTLLRLATAAGHSIRNVASLPTDELQALVQTVSPTDSTSAASNPPRSLPRSAERHIEDALAAIAELDSDRLDDILSNAVVEFGQQGILKQILVPLIEDIGDLWREGDLKVAHEHIATAVIRTFVGNLSRAHAVPSTAPRLIVTTPPGQLHELGAILVAATASNQGWRVSYLGPCLPAEEIAGAVLQNQARAVALSIVYPDDDPHLGNELVTLGRLVPEGTRIIAGGRAARSYESALKEIGADLIDDLPALKSFLDDLRLTSTRSAS
jgi:DNA-binding transcriptional MerR regulator/methylmalonyl-CoA mutase cobalamin-binding subunit